MLAADVSGDDRISTFDLVLISKVILGINESFPTPSWRFQPAEKNISLDPATDNLRAISGVDFTGIKMGDVTQSADPTK